MASIPTGLNVSDIVNVQVNLAPLAATFRNFGALLILGSTNEIDTNQRLRVYTSLAGVENDFGTTAPESLAATLFFSQAPQPAILYIGRWAQVATGGLLNCGVLSPTQQLLSNFTSISNGGFFVFIDGKPLSLIGVSLTGALNLNGVAALIQTGLQAIDGSSTVIWDAPQQRFEITSGTTGVSSSVSTLSAPTASGFINFSVNPLNNATVTIDGSVVTFVTGTPVSMQVKIGIDLPTTLQNLLTFLNSSVDSGILTMNYSVVGTKLYCVAKTPGVGGNSLTLAASVATVSAATLLGGNATDLSSLINGTISTAPAPVIGLAAETALQAVQTLDNISGLWYWLQIATATPPADADYLAVSAYIEGASRSHIHGITVNATTVLDATNHADLSSALHTLGYKRTTEQYSTSSPYAVASLIGRFSTVNFNAQNSVITGKFKQEPGIAGEFITESQAATLQAKDCNVYVNYQNGTTIIQEAVVASGFFIDEVVGTDWLQNQLQNNLFNVLYQSPTKIPQTDPGINILVNTCNDTLSGAVFNGLVAPGKWNVAGFGQLKQGDILTTGYYTFVIPVALQSQADREARKAPPLQVAIKLAGAVHFAFVIVTVNR